MKTIKRLAWKLLYLRITAVFIFHYLAVLFPSVFYICNGRMPIMLILQLFYIIICKSSIQVMVQPFRAVFAAVV